MANFTNRYPLNVPGKFYVDDQCLDCDLCREITVGMILRDDRLGHSYVSRQPETDAELLLFEESVEGCPMSAVGRDGDDFDWQTTPIMDWSQIKATNGAPLEFPESTAPVLVTPAKSSRFTKVMRILFGSSLFEPFMFVAGGIGFNVSVAIEIMVHESFWPEGAKHYVWAILIVPTALWIVFALIRWIIKGMPR